MRKDTKNKRRGPRGPSQRQLRAGELVRRALADIVGRGTIQDPDLQDKAITISEVRMSNDMRHATCYVAPLGSSLTGEDNDKLVAALVRVKSFLRGQLAKEVTFKFLPDLAFVADTSFDKAEAVDRLLHSPAVARDLLPARDEDDDGSDQELDDQD